MEKPWIERTIREAQEAGELEVSEGAGEPIPGLSAPYDPVWWARNWIERERAGDAAAELAKEIPSIGSQGAESVFGASDAKRPGSDQRQDFQAQPAEPQACIATA